MVRYMMSDLYISVGITLIEDIFKHMAIDHAEIVMFLLGCLKIIWFSQEFGLTVPIMQDLPTGLHG